MTTTLPRVALGELREPGEDHLVAELVLGAADHHDGTGRETRERVEGGRVRHARSVAGEGSAPGSRSACGTAVAERPRAARYPRRHGIARRRPGRGGVVTEIQLRLLGPGGEPVDLARTLNSHGFADLVPHAAGTGRARPWRPPLRVPGARPRRVRIAPGRPGRAGVEILGPAAGPRVRGAVEARGPPRAPSRSGPLGVLRAGRRRSRPRPGWPRGRAGCCAARPSTRTW